MGDSPNVIVVQTVIVVLKGIIQTSKVVCTNGDSPNEYSPNVNSPNSSGPLLSTLVTN